MIFCSDEESFKAEDSDERLNNSVGNLDEQIRNLSNQTIEFCQSIDEKAAIKKTIEKSNNSESRPFIEVTLPEESNSEKVLGKLSRKVSKLFGFFHLGNIRYTCRKQTYHFFLQKENIDQSVMESEAIQVGASTASTSASNIQHGTSNAFFRCARFQQQQVNINLKYTG